MKTSFQIQIDSSSQLMFFPHNRIKNKLQIIEILLEAARYILHAPRSVKIRTGSKIIFCRDKMNRIFFIDENKMYSIIFPFNVIINNKNISLNYKNIIEVDSFLISNLIVILKDTAMDSENCLDFVEQILDMETDCAINHWPIFKNLLMYEDGYIRYDFDEEGFASAKAKSEEHRHPKHHLDVFYTSDASFKLGLNNLILDLEFIDILNTNTNCKYLKNA